MLGGGGEEQEQEEQEGGAAATNTQPQAKPHANEQHVSQNVCLSNVSLAGVLDAGWGGRGMRGGGGRGGVGRVQEGDLAGKCQEGPGSNLFTQCATRYCGFGILRTPSSYRALEAVVWFQFHQPLASAPARGAAISARGRGGPSALRLALATCGAHCHQRLLHYHCCNGWLLAMHPTHAASPVLRRCRAPCRVGGGSEERRHGGGSDGGTIKALDGYTATPDQRHALDLGGPGLSRRRARGFG